MDVMAFAAFALVFGLGMVAGFLLAVALLGVIAICLPQESSWPDVRSLHPRTSAMPRPAPPPIKKPEFP
jgi:hypothetical protein